LKPSTYPLWFGPFILFAVAGFFLFRTLMKKKRARESALSEQDQERLRELLRDTSEIPDSKR
jgi:cytochrome c-type biogenesis protein CcmH